MGDIPNPGLDPSWGPIHGGSTKPTAPATEPSDPCANMANKLSNSAFTKVLDDLKSLTSAKYEAGRSYVYSNGSYSFTSHDGNENSASIDWRPTSASPIDGFVHTHYDGLLPTFSLDDIFIAYYWNKEGGVKNLNSFTFGLVTSTGTYFLSVSDVNKYNAFGNKYLDRTSLNALGIMYQELYGIKPGASATEATNNLAKFLKVLDTGLTLMSKSGTSFNKIIADK